MTNLRSPLAHGGTKKPFAPVDILELANTNVTSLAPPKFNGTNTVLTATVSGGGTLTYTFAGNLTNEIFDARHVGHDSDIELGLSGQVSLRSATEGLPTGGAAPAMSTADGNGSGWLTDLLGSYDAPGNSSPELGASNWQAALDILRIFGSEIGMSHWQSATELLSAYDPAQSRGSEIGAPHWQ